QNTEGKRDHKPCAYRQTNCRHRSKPASLRNASRSFGDILSTKYRIVNPPMSLFPSWYFQSLISDLLSETVCPIFTSRVSSASFATRPFNTPPFSSRTSI